MSELVRELADKSCDTKNMTKLDLSDVRSKLHHFPKNTWTLEEDKYIERSFKFKNFQESLDFITELSKIAEEENHHPDICFGWGWATLKIWTHKVSSLTENDLILASKIELLFVNLYG